VDIHFKGAAPVTDSVRVAILDSGGATLIPNEPQYFTVTRAKNSSMDYTLNFESRSASIADVQKGKPVRLRVTAGFGDRGSPTDVTFVPDELLYVKGTFWLRPYIYGFLVVLSVNLALILGAIYSAWARRLALDPTVRAFLGVGLFKYILTEPLLVHVPAVRNALFRDYRLHLVAKHPLLSQWGKRQYIAPRISCAGLGEPGIDGEMPALRSKELPSFEERIPDAPSDIYRDLLKALVKQTGPSRPVWLVQGPSGLGKSAFLQQVALGALGQGLSPLFVPLGGGQKPEDEVATLMSEYGDMNVDSKIASDMVDGGGFVILLDALNEDRTPAETLNFVRRARKRNVILVSSQYAPSWPSSVPLKHLDLAPFGPAQLKKILPQVWVDRILDSPHLSEVAALPITALLLGAYVSRQGSLPPSDFAIYTNLREGLNPNETMNLEQKAWLLFTDNSQQFKADDRLTAEFCEAAVHNSILTRRPSDAGAFYRFVHERVHRFFVACYLARQDGFEFVEWHARLDRSLGKRYWADVIEFLGATHALSDESIDSRTLAYTEFVRRAADFAPEILADRLYPQYIRYRENGDLATDQEFQGWVASFLTDLLSGRRQPAGQLDR